MRECQQNDSLADGYRHGRARLSQPVSSCSPQWNGSCRENIRPELDQP